MFYDVKFIFLDVKYKIHDAKQRFFKHTEMFSPSLRTLYSEAWRFFSETVFLKKWGLIDDFCDRRR